MKQRKLFSLALVACIALGTTNLKAAAVRAEASDNAGSSPAVQSVVTKRVLASELAKGPLRDRLKKIRENRKSKSSDAPTPPSNPETTS